MTGETARDQPGTTEAAYVFHRDGCPVTLRTNRPDLAQPLVEAGLATPVPDTPAPERLPRVYMRSEVPQDLTPAVRRLSRILYRD